MNLAAANAAALASVPEPQWYLDHVLIPAASGGYDDRPAEDPNDQLTPLAQWTHWWQQLADDLRDGSPAERLASQQGFVLTTAQALESGMSAAAVRRLLYRGTWWTPRRGVLSVVSVPAPDAADLQGAYEAAHRELALRCTAAALVKPGHVISGAGAATVYGLPVFAEPGEPQLTAPPPNTAGRRGRALVRPAGLGDDEVTDWFGARVTTVPRTVIDLARHGRRDGLVAADAAMRELGLRPDDLDTALARARGWPGVRRARGVLRLADPRAESPLESITRLACHDAALPPPELQVRIHDPALRRSYRVDALWREQRVILEMDGKLKYTGTELWREKRRQERLVRLGYRVIRVLWDDVVHDWPATLVRIRRTLADS